MEVIRLTGMELNDQRLEAVLKFLERGPASVSLILEALQGKGFDLSKATLNRDLSTLLDKGLIRKTGRAKATEYLLSSAYRLIRPIDFLDYFQVDPDDRKIQRNFNFEIFSVLKDIFTKDEQQDIKLLNKKYINSIKNISPTLQQKELERLTIELSWKSSKMEGNTYTLLDTERLIKEQIESEGHGHDEAVMILNHKEALDFVIKNKENYQELSVDKIKEVHRLLTKDLGIPEDVRERRVGILGTSYKPLEHRKEIQEALEKLCELINLEEDPFAKALIMTLMISYIQAFEDGNKRTARIMATAILMAYGYCPISFRSVDEFIYKRALILFYEQNNINFFKQLYIEQFKFSVDTYF